jgi:hypothetical protein
LISRLFTKFVFYFYSVLFNGTGADDGSFKLNDICIKMPITKPGCKSSTKLVCFEQTIFDIWSDCGDRDLIAPALDNLADAAAVKTVINRPEVKSGVSGKDVDMIKYLGGVTKDADGKIIKVTAIKFILLNQVTDLFPIEKHELWEDTFLELTLGLKLASNLQLYPMATRSFVDVSGESIGGDANLLSMGFMVVFIYIMIMLGKFNLVEQRAALALVGITSIVFGIATCYGLCSVSLI